MRLYYYTGKQWGMKALWEKRLKVARYADVNDPFELLPFNLQRKESLSFWQNEVASFISGHWGLLCFSEDWRSTLMWSHYGEKHTGMCLGFDVPRSEAIKIHYVSERKPDPLNHELELRGVTNELLEEAMRSKYDGWAYEKERRVKVMLQHPVDGLFFKSFDDSLHLREVILGARCSMAPIDVVEAVVNPPLDVEIFQARAAFGKFAICRHELVDTQTTKGFRAALALAGNVYADELPDEEAND